MLELPIAIHQRIQDLSQRGDRLAAEGKFEEAIQSFNEAWVIVPDPKQDWEASTWLLAAIGDCCFLGGFITSAREALEFALHCPNGFGNPFIHMRLGQCLLEQSQLELAADHLCRAYSIAGAEIFSTESSKYFDFLKTRIAPPASGGW